jgi:hypothetical protein
MDFSPAQINDVEKVAYWPETGEHLLAITGVMSDSVALEATKNWKAGFENPEIALKTLAEGTGLHGARRLIVLSHADREDDLQTLQFLDKTVQRRPGFAYLLGGHDHDVNWSQVNLPGPTGHAVFSKSLSNFRSLRVFLMSRSQLIVDELRHLVRASGVMANLQDKKFFGKRGECVGQQIRTQMLEILKSEEIGCDVGVRLNADALCEEEPQEEFANMVEEELEKDDKRSKESFVKSRLGIDKIDIRDRQMRSAPMPFGTFVAECVRRGTGAHYALIHSGCFRGDDVFPAVLSEQLLYNLFIYDQETAEPKAILLAELERTHLEALVCYGRKKKGHGAYPQCSPTELPDNSEMLKVAIPLYILEKEQDGYRDIFTNKIRWTKDQLDEKVSTWKQKTWSIIELVKRCEEWEDCLKLLEGTAHPPDDDQKKSQERESFVKACEKIKKYFDSNPDDDICMRVRRVFDHDSPYASIVWCEWSNYSRIEQDPTDGRLTEACQDLRKWLAMNKSVKERMNNEIRGELSQGGRLVEEKIAEATTLITWPE